MTSTISELATSGLRHSTSNTFIINTTPRNRVIREKPILGIDYDKLRYGNRKNAFSTLSQCSSPREELGKSQSTTAAQFRVNTPSRTQEKLTGIISSNNQNNNSAQNSYVRYDLKNMPQKKLSSKDQQQQYFLAEKKNNNDQTEYIAADEQADYETFKKYQKEFQEFRRQQKHRMQTSNGGVSERGASRSNWYQDDSIGQNNSKTMRIQHSRHSNSRSQVFTDKSLDMQSLGKMSERLFDSVRRSRQASEWVQQSPQQEQQSKQLDKNTQQEQSEQLKQLETLPDVVQQINSAEILQSPRNINTNNNKEGAISTAATASNPNNTCVEKTSSNWKCQPQPENDVAQLTLQQSCCPSCASEPIQQTYYSKLVNKYIDINSDYYKHLTGDCLCGRCICGKCRCPYKSIPVDLKRALQTNYQHDFSSPSAISSVPTISMPFFTQQQQLPNINTISTNQQDFKAPEGVDQQIFAKAPSSRNQTGPFLATSSYQSNFIDWKTKQIGHVRAPQDLTIAADVPFIAKSLYADSYGKDRIPQKDKEFEEFIKAKSKSMFSSPLNPDFRYIPQSTSQQFFQSPKFYPSAMFNPYQGETELTPAVPDQFKSQAAREYDDKSKVQCPSQLVIMEMNRRRKLKNELEFDKSKTKYEELVKDKKAVTMNQLFETAKIKPQRLLAL